MLVALFGFLFGFLGSLPMAGPIGALILGKSLDGQLRAALHIGLGAALAESAYAALAFLGFSTLLADYPFMLPASRAIAAVMLFGLGFNFILRKRLPMGLTGEDLARPVRSAMVGFSMSVVNASLLATWGAAAASTMSLTGLDGAPALSVPFGVGALLGISAWYGLLITLMRRNLHRFELRTLGTVIRSMGVLLIGLGISFVAWTGVA